jgi:hypothetical protein
MRCSLTLRWNGGKGAIDYDAEVGCRRSTGTLCRLVLGEDVLEAYLLVSKATVAAIYWQQQSH